MIYVQHLLGIGHLRRSWFLACALADRNISVDLVTGGMPVADLSDHRIRVRQLPPVRSLDGNFNRFVDEQDQPIDDNWRDHRCNQLLDLYDDINPDLLITETFPFGRRMMRFELLPLLQKAKNSNHPPLIIASIRDILQPKSKPGRDEEVLKWINGFYDQILIHGQESVAPLNLTFPFAGEIENKLNYTGYIADHKSIITPSNDGENEVIVSGGGGAASLNLLETAIAAKPLSDLNRQTWRLLVGHNLDNKLFVTLKQSAGEGICVERNRPDFSSLLRRCAVSVSQAGYNTVMDILKQHCHAVLVPYAEANEVEQSLRANQLESSGRVASLSEEHLSPETLAKAIDQAAQMSLPKKDVNLHGARRSAELIENWINER